MTSRRRPIGAVSRVAFCVPLIATLAAAPRAPRSSAHAAQETVPPQQGLTGGSQIARTYNAILDARFTTIPALLRETCPPAPAEVCTLLEAVAQWWRIQLDPNDISHDAAFHARVEEAIEGITRWTERAPEAGEAFFYLGGAYGARAQWRVLRGERLAAARDGKRIKDALEQSLMLDPTLQDAYFGIGLYHYYADVAPVAAKVVRWLLLLPGGDKEAGLREMAPDLPVVREAARPRPRSAARASHAPPAEPALPAAHRARRGRLPARRRRQPAHVAGAAR
jgi:hypothetical protein